MIPYKTKKKTYPYHLLIYGDEILFRRSVSDLNDGYFAANQVFRYPIQVIRDMQCHRREHIYLSVFFLSNPLFDYSGRAEAKNPKRQISKYVNS